MKTNIHLQPMAALLAAVTFAAIGSGCAALRAAAERRSRIHAKVQEHVYTQPLPEVWAAARALLFEMGYEVANAADAQAPTLETTWRHDGTRKVRYLVQAVPVARGAQVRILESQQLAASTLPPSTRRDLDAEWQLLARLDARASAEIEAYATSGDRTGGAAANASASRQLEGSATP